MPIADELVLHLILKFVFKCVGPQCSVLLELFTGTVQNNLLQDVDPKSERFRSMFKRSYFFYFKFHKVIRF